MIYFIKSKLRTFRVSIHVPIAVRHIESRVWGHGFIDSDLVSENLNKSIETNLSYCVAISHERFGAIYFNTNNQYACIVYESFTLKWQGWSKSYLVEVKDLPISVCQYRGGWWGWCDFRNIGTSFHATVTAIYTVSTSRVPRDFTRCHQACWMTSSKQLKRFQNL